jgi:O-acetyl-ADP-ribose deacetylase (regulator of RNase III)
MNAKLTALYNTMVRANNVINAAVNYVKVQDKWGKGQATDLELHDAYPQLAKAVREWSKPSRHWGEEESDEQ